MIGATTLKRLQCASRLCNRPASRFFSTEAASHPSNKTQVYLSQSHDPLLNLSVEHHLLQTSPPDSTILLLYVNSPCIVFGRNQNPWIEANLSEMASLDQQGKHVQLVRRRSGGGTVFHDHGNVNFSVICPPEQFNRDKHAEMVVRALKGLGRPNARVNARHDIVIDADDGTFKISGSAYKLTRLRSLHHGTCLLRSPNLGKISAMLKSPAEGLIRARGVDSVRSPVRNVDVDNEEFEDAVVQEFGSMYGELHIREQIHHEAAMQVEKVQQGYKELQSRNWVYGQTPRFTFCTHPTEEDERPRSGLPFNVSENQLHVKVLWLKVSWQKTNQATTHRHISGSMLDREYWSDLKLPKEAWKILLESIYKMLSIGRPS